MVMQNALKLALCVALSGTAVFASESGKLAARAQKSLKAGNFAKGYSQLDRALIASRKEADRRSEARIMIAMGQVRTRSLDFSMADSLLNYVENEGLDRSTRAMLVKAKMALKNDTEKYGEAVKLCEGFDEDVLDKLDDQLQGAFYSECAIAYAGSQNGEKAAQALKMVGKSTDDDTGIYYWTEARLADMQKSGNADSLYRKAEAKSVEANTPFATANILYHRGKVLEKTNPTEAKKVFARCKTAFELMGLEKNSKRCGD
ncbi:hypothetical protein [Fibrobacter sp. UWB11]|uniref:hypothetical protein n=1 Tax=Fibrobacter sp. UWB11 TaxID=1896202 RepID=UPI0009289659|nr:hypothetical protein [Fibrobacter sp. UWB11]SIO40431.1 hypothetical protein SAMN05720758_2707 [Fibrobacter sp. UWB11]